MGWEIRAGCKVNLCLDIVGVREDGYHEIESLFYPLPIPCDVMSIVERPEPGLALSCSIPALAPDDNIISRAYDRFARQSGFTPGLAVHLEKNIPMGAGLGGGSSDAAAFLLWLNAQAGAKALGMDDLHVLALSLGADVPFFLSNRPAWVTGIGERVRRVELDLSRYAIVLVCPDVHVNTKWAYGRWDELHGHKYEEGRKSLTLDTCEIKNFCFTNLPVLRNSFERIVFQEFPVLYEIKKRLLQFGADGCVMSGSGSSIVAVFEVARDALQSAEWMRDSGFSCHLISSDDVHP